MADELHHFSTGAKRSADVDSERWDLLSPIALRREAQVAAFGAGKYGEHNWENGMPVIDCLNHAIAHIYNYLNGDDSEDHLGHARWNLGAAIHSEVLWPHLNQGLRRRPGGYIPPKFDATASVTPQSVTPGPIDYAPITPPPEQKTSNGNPWESNFAGVVK